MIRAKSGRIIRRSLAEINPWAKDGLGENDLALGNAMNRRRLIDAGAAFLAYAACDPKAETEREAYLSACWFADDCAPRRPERLQFRSDLESHAA